jgi:hypothetical protein
VCGGGLIVESSSRKRGRRFEYVCHRRRTNGSCTNTPRIAVEEMNEAVLQAVEEHALTAEAVEQVLNLTERDEEAEHLERLRREQADVERRIGRLVAAVEAGGAVASLVAKLREREAGRGSL